MSGFIALIVMAALAIIFGLRAAKKERTERLKRLNHILDLFSLKIDQVHIELDKIIYDVYKYRFWQKSNQWFRKNK